jgi:hypothetical protein
MAFSLSSSGERSAAKDLADFEALHDARMNRHPTDPRWRRYNLDARYKRNFGSVSVIHRQDFLVIVRREVLIL